jgi:hypothetical protein
VDLAVPGWLRPGEECPPLQGRSLWESSPPKNPTSHPGKQEIRRRLAHRPRLRRCLLKGCGERFHPRQARHRYCSEGCRKAARKWSRWKAQQRYRTTRVDEDLERLEQRLPLLEYWKRYPGHPTSSRNVRGLLCPPHTEVQAIRTGFGRTFRPNRAEVFFPCR